MPLPTLITDLSTTPAANSPPGFESINTADDYLRVLSAFIRQLYDKSPSAGTGYAVFTAGVLSAIDAAALRLQMQDTGLTAAAVGFRDIPGAIKSSDYTIVAADSGKMLIHPSSDTTARTFTIPSNAAVAFPIGTAITFANENAAGVVSIAINSDTLRMAGGTLSGTRTLAANGLVTAVKTASTRWLISGAGLS